MALKVACGSVDYGLKCWLLSTRYGDIMWRLGIIKCMCGGNICLVLEKGSGIGNWLMITWWAWRVKEKNTLFWQDSWFEGGPLCNIFRRFFELIANHYVLIVEMWRLGWGIEDAAWNRRMRLFAFEEKLMEECVCLLDNILCRIALMTKGIEKLILVMDTKSNEFIMC